MEATTEQRTWVKGGLDFPSPLIDAEQTRDSEDVLYGMWATWWHQILILCQPAEGLMEIRMEDQEMRLHWSSGDGQEDGISKNATTRVNSGETWSEFR